MRVNIYPDNKKQVFKGFGTSLSWWANIVGAWDMKGKTSKEVREEICELVFDKDKGLGINIVRYHIAGGDDPEHNHIVRKDSKIPGYKVDKDSEYNWDADKNQLWVLEKANNILEDEFILEVFNISPPWWMTKSGCSCGHNDKSKDNLKEECYEEFAKYIVDVTKYVHVDKGIKVDYLEPINEPESDYWEAFSPKQEGCHFSTGKVQDKVYQTVYKELVRQELHDEIKLTGVDETDIDMTIDEINALSPETLKVISKINTHAYSGTKRKELKVLVDKLDKELWMSEYCTGDTIHDDNDMKSALQLSRTIIKDINELEAEAWILWQILEDEIDNVKYNGSWGLIHGIYRNSEELKELKAKGINVEGYKEGDIFITKQFYVTAHYSKFIRKGYSIIQNDSDNTVSAISNDGEELVIVLINDSLDKVNVDICVNSLSEYKHIIGFETNREINFGDINVNTKDEYLNITMEKESVVTIVLKKGGEK